MGWNKKKTVGKALKYISKYKLYITASVILALLSVVGTLYVPILIGKAVDLVVGKIQYKAIMKILISIGAIVAFTAIFQWIMNLCNNKITFNVIKDIRNDAFKKIQRLPLKYIDSKSSGEIVSRVIADVDQFADGLLMGFSQFFTGIITILGTIIFMLSINIWITIAVIFVTPLSLFVAAFIARKTFRLFGEQSRIRGEQTAYIDEIIGNQKTVKAFSHEEESEKKFNEINERLKKSSTDSIFFSSITNPSTRFINGVVYALVGTIGAFFAIKGAISVGQLTSFLNYSNQYTKPFNEISGVVTELQNAIACAERVFSLIDEKIDDSDKNIKTDLKNVNGSVEFDNVCFSYDKSKKLIENFNLNVKSGQTIAIVGPTGCGKTTLINLLMRFYDADSGIIRVSGMNVKDITIKSLRSSYGMVLQETWLKSGSVRENIVIGKPDATDDEVIEAAKKSNAHSFIKRLPNGYDTMVSDESGNLSQGEKQLICIARVMLALPPMLILDEATSSVDTRTEINIQKAFNKMMNGRTSFVVAHRLSTIKKADVILVMKDGNVIEQGRHDELMNRGGFYANLYNDQFA